MRATRIGPAEADPTEIDAATTTKLIRRNILLNMTPPCSYWPRLNRCEMNAASS
jgi:hypothetical protein